MFNLKDWIAKNLISAYHKKEFSAERVSILAADYMVKGVFDISDVEAIALELTKPLPEPEPEPPEPEPPELEILPQLEEVRKWI